VRASYPPMMYITQSKSDVACLLILGG
jgi:hypothetical protein